MNEHKPQPVAIFIGIAIAIVFLALGIAVWVEGPGQGWSRNTRIIIELSLLSALLLSLLFVKYFEAVVLWIASMRAARWLAQYDWNRQSRSGSGQAAQSREAALGHPAALRDALRERHGWRWRYRDRWVVVVGDEPIVKRLAPSLVQSGHTISGDTVLLYAKQTGDQLDTAWLDQIRRLRRRRPVDAVVAVVRVHTSGHGPIDAEHTAQRLVRHARALRWAAPAYLLNVTDSGIDTFGPDEAIGCTWSNARPCPGEVSDSLRGLSDELADAGVVRLTKDATDRYPAELSQHIARYGSAVSDLVTQIGLSRIWRRAIHGVLFTPLFKERVAESSEAEKQDGEGNTILQRTVWQTVADHSRSVHGRRVGFSFSNSAAWLLTALVSLWIAGTMFSGVTNRSAIHGAADTLMQLSEAQDHTQSALTLDTLQKQLDTLEIRQHDGAPWFTRFGLNRDTQLLAALWPSYESAANRLVVAPIRAKLEERLRQLASLSDEEIASGGDTQIKSAYATLKAYLMLAKPEHADAKFLTPQLTDSGAPTRPVNSTLSIGAWEDLRQHLIAFYASHLGQHVAVDGSSLAIIPDASLVNGTRQTIIGVRGIQNSTDAIYQQILDEAKPKYPPVSLATLLGDTNSRGLFNTTATVPGVFTRAAWDERISKAIDDASEQRRVMGDWVLSDNRTGATIPSSLKTELRQRYFDDYAREWEQFLNSLRWQPDATLSGTVDQLTLLADPQRSPLAALMNVVVYQAGTGALTQSLSDSLINKAQQLVGADEKDPSKIAQSQNVAPLAAAFGPLLRLAGSDLAGSGVNAANGKGAAQMAATGDLSVPRYMERVTAMRLKLQQIMMGSDPDAMSRAAAQSVLQGKTSDIADSRDYASRVSASLGEQWAGFGDLFDAPLDQTWQVVLQPAASSLNDTWRTAIVADWDKSFGGRYPFADSENDASLPEMARFMRPDNGVIAQFVTTQLAGIVERQGDRWVPAQGANRSSLTVDPAFLAALNKLMRVSTVLFPSGDAHIRYELRAVPTPGVTDMKFVLSGRELHYFNQKEEWTPFVWPGDALDNIAHIEWQTEQGGLRSALDMQGRFGFIRLLERAKVMPQDSARYLLTWMPDATKEATHPAGSAPAAPDDGSEGPLEGNPLGATRSSSSAHGKEGTTSSGMTPPPSLAPGLGTPLRLQLRSEAGAGPLDVLALRNFTLPGRIFMTAPVKGAQKPALAGPPPLPPAAIAAAKHAAVPLPHGALPEVE
ncbi:ImcF-related family protein [Paraburkholderia phenazinium]|uniref:Type VI secretion system protein ImpL n=1 Tax=Paraburkholderia phenazinium TaxID=60549 RepID=A0A1G7U0J2_9BURK|nr:ImcF-related family protein [Paraburkholderia phenazinium]SDG40874.1 type VI secretion system protein ImpL [Paraburkholderia phenazinium]